MKVARMMTGPLLAVKLLTAFYLPKRGQAALDENFKQFQQCGNYIADYFWAPGDPPPYNGCFEHYINRREQMLWRYFFFHTLVTHL